jgi:hypothetical protein
MSITQCDHCERPLAPSANSPIVAMSNGTFHWKCWEAKRAEDAKRQAKEDRAAEKVKAARAAAASERMKARWAAKAEPEDQPATQEEEPT